MPLLDLQIENDTIRASGTPHWRGGHRIPLPGGGHDGGAGSGMTSRGRWPGDAPRNSVRGPLFWQTDLAVSRRLAMPWRAGALELRAEFFNVLNRTNFRAPNGDRSAAAFGTITQT